MSYGVVLGDAIPVASGVLAVDVFDSVERESLKIHVEHCPAALCIEREDTLFWDDTKTLWSPRSRVVYDVEIKRVAAPGGTKK